MPPIVEPYVFKYTNVDISVYECPRCQHPIFYVSDSPDSNQRLKAIHRYFHYCGAQFNYYGQKEES